MTGQFGPVYRAHRATETVRVPVALKPIKSLLLTEADVNNFLKEISVLRCIRHPNVAQVYGLVEKGLCVCVCVDPYACLAMLSSIVK